MYGIFKKIQMKIICNVLNTENSYDSTLYQNLLHRLYVLDIG